MGDCMDLSIETFLILLITVIIISASTFLLIRWVVKGRNMNQKITSTKTKKELMLEIDYTINKYIEGLRSADEVVSNGLGDNLDRTINDLVHLILFEYSNTITTNMPTEDVCMVQDLLELYLTRDLYIILEPKLKQIYNVDLTRSTEQSELTDLVENFTHNLIDSMALGIKKYSYISRTFGNIENVLTENTRKIFDELRMSVGRLSSIRTTYDDTVASIKKEASDKVCKLIEKKKKTENVESIN